MNLERRVGWVMLAGTFVEGSQWWLSVGVSCGCCVVISTVILVKGGEMISNVQ